MLELAGWAVVVLALMHAGGALVVTVSRQRMAAEVRRQQLRLFRLRAREVLAQSALRQAREEHGWSGLRKLRVDGKRAEAPDVFSFTLRAHDGKPLPPFLPGQYLTLSLKLPGASGPAVRCYSLSDAPGDADRYRITVRRIHTAKGPGLASGHLCDRVQPGDLIDAKQPAGNFHLRAARDRPVVLVGGGIGVTPLLSMAEALCAEAEMPETWLFYGVRDGDAAPFLARMEELAASRPEFRVVVCHSRSAPSRRLRSARCQPGRVTIDTLRGVLPSADCEFYLCGPAAMMADLSAGLHAWGVPDAQVHTEAFGPASVSAPAIPVVSGAEVEFHRAGRTIVWTGEHASLLELAEAHGIDVEAGCRTGQCGTCASAVHSGRFAMIAEPGAEIPAGSCLLCISRPEGRLVVDA